MPDINQTAIINKIIAYLNLEERDKIVRENIKDGVCLGLTSMWMFHKLHGNENSEFFDILNKIVNCDIDNINSMGQEIDVFLQHTLSMHGTISTFIPEFTQFNQNNTHEALGVNQEAQFAFSFYEDELQDTLLQLASNDKLVHISSNDHAISLVRKNNKFYLYDPNHSDGEREYSLNEMDALVHDIYGCYYTENVTPSDTLSININVMDDPLFQPENLLHRKPIKPFNMIEHVEAILNKRQYESTEARLQDLYKLDPSNGNALILAIKNNCTELLELYINKYSLNPSVHVQRNYHEDIKSNLLSYAVTYNQPEIITLLINNGAKIGMREQIAPSAITYAVGNDNVELIEKFLQSPHTVLQLNCAVREFVLKYKTNMNTLNSLFKNGANVNASITHEGEQMSLLELAILEKNSNALNELLKYDVNVNVISNALMTAIKEDNVLMAKTLIEAGADLTQKNEYELSCLDYTDFVEPGTDMFLLIQEKANDFHKKYLTQQKQENPDDLAGHLSYAIEHDLTDEIQALCQEHTTTINDIKIDGMSPLCFAIQHNKLDIIKSLIENGIDINKPDKQGNTPLMNAIKLAKSPQALYKTVTTLIAFHPQLYQKNKAGENVQDLLQKPSQRKTATVINKYIEKEPMSLLQPVSTSDVSTLKQFSLENSKRTAHTRRLQHTRQRAATPHRIINPHRRH